MVKISNSNKDGSAIRTNIDGSGRLTPEELATIGNSALRGSQKKLRETSQTTNNIFSRFINAFKQWRQAEEDIWAFEHGNHERMIDYFMDLPPISTVRTMFEPRMQKLANELASKLKSDTPGTKTYLKNNILLSQLELRNIKPSKEE